MKRVDCRLFVLILFLFSAAVLQAQVPKPDDVFGFRPGADYKIADYRQVKDYYTRLDAATDRVQLIEIGKSVQGRPMLLLFISSEANMKRLEDWRSISGQLALAKIDSVKARQLASGGKAIVWIDAGLHASEKACAQMAPELAYRIATEETEEMKRIRDNVITLIMPVMNPDGLDIVAHWYQQYLGTPYETTEPAWLYHQYVGHDNNRDWFMNNMPETKAVSEVLYKQWYPQIVYNQHQTAPAWTKILIPPYSDPVNPNIHPAITNAVSMIGTAMAARYAMEKMPGAISRVSYDMWWNGGMRTAPYYHNQIGILTETAHPSPTPRTWDPKELPKTVGGGTITTDGTAISYAYPWKGGLSTFRSAVDYMLTASMAVLDMAAHRKEEYLYDMYRMGRDAVERKDGPFAYVIPAQQWDGSEARNLVNILLQGGIEIQQAAAAFTVNGKNYEAGSYIIYGAQAFRPYITDLLEKQVYPDLRQYPGGPPDAPYDLTGWTLPMQMGVTVEAVSQSFTAAAMQLKDSVALKPGKMDANAKRGYVLDDKNNAAFKAVNSLLKAGFAVSRATTAFANGGKGYSAGAFIIEKGTPVALAAIAKQTGVDFDALAAKLSVSRQAIQPAKIGLYKSWMANMDEGWTRWIMEQYNFTVDTLHDKDIQTKDLRQYKAIIIPDQSRMAILNGHRKDRMPQQYTGGMGTAGAAAIKAYVAGGGNLLTFDGACDFAIEQFDLPVQNAVAGLKPEQFYIPGSLVKIELDAANPLTYGMQPAAAASFNRSTAFSLGKKGDSTGSLPAGVAVVASYAPKDVLMSGWALGGDQYIGGKAAMLNIKQGQGHITLFGFRPQFRAQTRATYKLIFNAIYQ